MVAPPSPEASPVLAKLEPPKSEQPPPPKVEEPKIDVPEGAKTPKSDDREKEFEKLVQKGRLLMVSGHAHTAADTLQSAGED